MHNCRINIDTTKEFILVSACLLGKHCRYDGDHRKSDDVASSVALAEDKGLQIIAFCPESQVFGIPRPPCMIYNGDGQDVLKGTAQVLDKNNKKITQGLIKGAELALSQVKKYRITQAIMKEKSPSCGVRHVYNGNTGKLVSGMGVTSALLQSNGVELFSELDCQNVI